MSKQNTYGSQLEINMFCRITNTNITVFRRYIKNKNNKKTRDDEIIKYTEEVNGRINLYLMYDDYGKSKEEFNHYSPVIIRNPNERERYNEEIKDEIDRIFRSIGGSINIASFGILFLNCFIFFEPFHFSFLFLILKN